VNFRYLRSVLAVHHTEVATLKFFHCQVTGQVQ